MPFSLGLCSCLLAGVVLDIGGTAWLHEAGRPETGCQVTIPGDVHSALLEAGRIPDPFYGRNEENVQWVAERDWVITRTFAVDAALLRHTSVTLRLESPDTFVTLYLNGHRLGETSSRYRRWEFEVRPLLKAGTNELKGVFASTAAKSRELKKSHPYALPMVQNGKVPDLNLVRKPICHGGWDWGLAQMTTGFCGPVTLIATDDARIDYVRNVQRFAADDSSCEVTVSVSVTAPVRVTDVPFEVVLDGQTVARTVSLDPGPNELSLAVTVVKPRLWWPNGAGEPYLYPLIVRVGSATDSRRIGLRRIAFEHGEDDKGYALGFTVNGRRIFAKGASWVPCDAFESRQTPARYRDLLQSAVAANMNMIRVWGGGQYEREVFYEICDELGLLVWQDFMFCCAVYPASPEFLAAVRDEAEHQVRRLQSHPSLALWCGDNECLGILGTSGPAGNPGYTLAGYGRRRRVLADAVATYDPTREFWPGSPLADPHTWFDPWKLRGRGDMHFWKVWFSDADISEYRNVKPRFCSEFGFQSFPSLELAKTFCDPVAPDNPDFAHHQKHAETGNRRIMEMLRRHFREPKNFADTIYLSQVLQAEALRIAVEHWRSLGDECRGALFWQLNDNWPVASWSAVEYGGKWKPLMYAAKRFFAEPMRTEPPPPTDPDRIGPARISSAFAEVPEGVAVTLEASEDAFFVWMNVEGVRGEFDDNFFTLKAHEPRRAVFTPKRGSLSLEEFRRRFSVKHLGGIDAL